MIQNPEQYLITAGGKIRCRRCKAQSSRTKLQCAKPSLKGKTVCQFHGGLSTGPKTQEGKDAIRRAHWKDGESTKESREKQSAKNLMFCYLEDLVNHLPLMPVSNKRVGRKPKGYVAYDLHTEEGLAMAIIGSLGKDN
ncbi:hypothetical protein G6677_00205 [Polynucleobacter paneuropaeus]|nr:hypothetical protein [Polynucleobacter paneuropaeus]